MKNHARIVTKCPEIEQFFREMGGPIGIPGLPGHRPVDILITRENTQLPYFSLP